jgi:ABC-type uncharacterized transport system auxiliary subunit
VTRLALPATVLLATALTGGACRGKLPETRYYQLATPATSASSLRDTRGIALAIEPLVTDPAYDDERIVYRVTPYRLDYYNYHRWSSPPGTLIAEYLERSFERSGRFGDVTRDAQGAPVTLGGRVIALEEVDRSKTEWVGRIVVELRLTDTATGELVWSEQFEETQRLDQQSPEGLARALSAALHRIATRALPAIADHAVHVADKARPRAPAGKPAPSRAARLRP